MSYQLVTTTVAKRFSYPSYFIKDADNGINPGKKYIMFSQNVSQIIVICNENGHSTRRWYRDSLVAQVNLLALLHTGYKSKVLYDAKLTEELSHKTQALGLTTHDVGTWCAPHGRDQQQCVRTQNMYDMLATTLVGVDIRHSLITSVTQVDATEMYISKCC